MRCKFRADWMGQCQGTAVVRDGPGPEIEYCYVHVNRRCVVCAEQATHSCAETNVLVCGALLCDDHHHEGAWKHQ